MRDELRDAWYYVYASFENPKLCKIGHTAAELEDKRGSTLRSNNPETKGKFTYKILVRTKKAAQVIEKYIHRKFKEEGINYRGEWVVAGYTKVRRLFERLQEQVDDILAEFA